MLLLLSAALAAAPVAAQSPGRPALPATDYAAEANWLCLPGREDACSRPQQIANLEPNGFGPVTERRPAAEPPTDCFYVYPTVSRDVTLNSDLNPGPEEQAVAAVQFAPFAGICRPFAPMHRQATLASIPFALAGQDPAPLWALAFDDVRLAWRHYLAHHNRGRPFVLIGHSQGTVHLIRLLAEEIEGRPEAARMMSALLIGYNVEVPEGQAVGGTFRSTPLCTRAGQTGCVISYVSFRAEAPPPAGAIFGRTARPGMTIACTNPAALGRATNAPLDSFWFTEATAARQLNIIWSSAGAPAAPVLRTRGLVSAACVNSGPLGYFAISVNADPGDARTDRIPGDVSIGGQLQAGWGMHLVDINVAQGDLIRAIEAQASAFRRRR